MWNKAFVLGVCVSILLISSIASAQELQDYNGDCVADIKDIVIKETHRQGDVNWDGKVDIKDLVTLAMNFHKTSEDLDWDPRWDVANDVGIVNVKDLAVVAQGIQIRSLGTPLSGTAIVYVDPPSSNVVKGQNFTINVSIDTVDPLYGYQVYVYFNTSVISGVEVTSGPFLGGGFFGNGIDNTTGIILIYDSKIGEVPGTSGSGVLAIVTFHADNYGESYLNLEDVKLIDENVTEIASTQENGTVKTYTPVTGCMDINASGTYLLENDVSTSSSQRCMNITASDVVLDCQGHKIDGLGSMSSGSGIYAGSSSARLNNVVISNCIVTGWHNNGIAFYSNNGKIMDTNVSLSTQGILFEGSNNTMSGLVLSSNNNFGFKFNQNSDYNIINDSRIENNTQYGITLTYDSSNRPEYNIIYNNYFNNSINYYPTDLTNYFNTTKRAGTSIIGSPYIGGNYWGSPSHTGYSDTCWDVTDDYICETPYQPDTTNMDNLPLTYNHDNPPVADAGGPYTGNEGSMISFNGSGSYDPDSGDSIVSYEWDLDNDSQYDDATGISASYTWNDNYTVTIGIRVTDSHGRNGIDSTTVTVNNVAPTANAGLDQSGDEGSVFYFSGSATDPGTDTLTYDWNFGDGEIAAGQSPSHIYADNGVYIVTLTVTDEDGGSGTDTLTVTVNNVAPTAEAGGPYSCDQGSSVSLTGSATDPGDDIFSYAWDLNNDGGTYETPGQSVSYSCDSVGTFTVGFRVTDDDGGQGTDTTTVTVNQVVTPKPDLVVSSYQVTPGNNNYYMITFKIRNQGNAVVAGDFYWDITAPSSLIDPIGTLAVRDSMKGNLDPLEESGPLYAYVRYTLPGTYAVTIIADYNNTITESNEVNNQEPFNVVA